MGGDPRRAPVGEHRSDVESGVRRWHAHEDVGGRRGSEVGERRWQVEDQGAGGDEAEVTPREPEELCNRPVTGDPGQHNRTIIAMERIRMAVHFIYRSANAGPTALYKRCFDDET